MKQSSPKHSLHKTLLKSLARPRAALFCQQRGRDGLVVCLSTIILLIFTLVFPTSSHGQESSDQEREPLVLADSGQTSYVIVLPASPSPVQQFAAQELQSTLKQITDADFPLVTETQANQDPSQKQLVIGPSQTSRALLSFSSKTAATASDENRSVEDKSSQAPLESSLGYDGILLKRIGNSLVFSGHPKRGMLYAVNTFLEENLGCRYWTSKESLIPKSSRVTVESLDHCYTPKLQYRESYYHDAHDGAFSVKMKCNGNGNAIPEEWGGHHQFCYFVHSFYQLIPPDRYFLDHPDWFCEIDGIRKVGYPTWGHPRPEIQALLDQLSPEQIVSTGTQLCLSNDEMRQELVKNAMIALEQNPNASFLSISQNDWHGYCQCEKCSKIAEEEGSQSGVLLRFVNQVAEEIEKVRPDVFVETLAYQYTRKPPKITHARHNVVVRLCSIECSFSQTLNDGEQNRSFKEDMEGWSKMAEHLFVWDYVTDFALYLLPFPNYHVLDDNIRFYIDHHTIGLFEQGDYECATGDFVQMRNWIIAKMLWNPDLNQDQLMEEFIAGYYAPELVPIYREYFELLSRRVQDSGIHLGIYKTSTREWMNLETLNRVTELQNQAVQIAESLEKAEPEKHAGLVHKVWRERIPLDLVWLQDAKAYQREAQLKELPFSGPSDMASFAKEWSNRLDQCGLTLFREAGTLEDFQAFKRDLIEKYTKPKTSQIPVFFNELPKISWFEIQNDECHLSNIGTWTFVDNDPAASDGQAIKMPGWHNEWAISWPFDEEILWMKPALSPTQDSPSTESAVTSVETTPPQYRIYASVRCDAQTTEGTAMSLGVYDNSLKKDVFSKTIPVSEISGDDYHLIDLGAWNFTPGQLFWAAPPKRPDEIDAVYLDRFIMVREK